MYKVIYRPGKNNLADPLSRLCEDNRSCSSFDEEVDHYVYQVTEFAIPVSLKLLVIEDASSVDEEIQLVRKGLFEKVWDPVVNNFKIFETELCFTGNILLRGTRIVIPKLLRPTVLKLAHEGHPGMTVMKRRLRAKVWWPKIDTDAENVVKKCRGCILVSTPDAPEPLKRKELPFAPWQHIAVDYLGPLPTGHYLFVVVDYYSRYIEVEIMTKIDSNETIKCLRIMFARFGLPFSITADNGSQFISEEFKIFCEEMNIRLISTTPYWPQQNGEVERQNRSLLKRLVISQNTNRDWKDDLQNYLLMYRATSHSITGKSPAMLMFNREIRDKLPQIDQPLERDEEVFDLDKENKEKGKMYTDERRRAKDSDITVGDDVVLKVQKKLNKLSPNFGPEQFTVIERNGSEVLVSSKSSGKQFRRNTSAVKRIFPSSDDELTSNIAEEESSRPKRKIVKPPRFN